jgi:hypothetical protein
MGQSKDIAFHLIAPENHRGPLFITASISYQRTCDRASLVIGEGDSNPCMTYDIKEERSTTIFDTFKKFSNDYREIARAEFIRRLNIDATIFRQRAISQFDMIVDLMKTEDNVSAQEIVINFVQTMHDWMSSDFKSEVTEFGESFNVTSLTPFVLVDGIRRDFSGQISEVQIRIESFADKIRVYHKTNLSNLGSVTA